MFTSPRGPGCTILPPPPGFWDLEGILGGSNLSPLSPEPCVLSWLLCTCLMGFLEEGEIEPRLWGRRKRGGRALLLPEAPTLQSPSWL